MRIVILGTLPKPKENNRSYGGAEKTMINLSGYLAKKGYDVYFCSVAGDDLIYPIDNKVKLFLTSTNHTNRYILQFKTMVQTKKILKKINPDIVISFWLHPSFYALNLRKKYKLIFCERNNPETIYSSFSKKLLKIVLKKSDGLIFQTQGVLDQFSNLNIKEKSIIIPNPIYIKKEDYKYIENKDNRIVNIGRLSEQKNQKLLIKAFSKIEKKYPDLILEIYGEGNLEDSLNHQISEYNLTNKVFLKGTSKNVLQLIHSSKLFLFTSLYEGMPNVIIEAQGLGIPCISSNCPPGGPAYLIQNNKTGLLFENDNLDDLVEKLCFALDNYDKMIDMSKTAYHNVYIKHDVNNIFAKWESFINKVMKG